MKREQQSQIMIEKIINSAINVFNEYDYESASMNDICKRGNISKGIIYHYFKDKDELYLRCVEICFHTLADDYRKENLDDLKLTEGILAFMRIRMNFFDNHPEFRGLFFNAILRTPPNLKSEVNALKNVLDVINQSFFKKQLLKVKLKNNISIDRAVTFLNIQVDAFNDYFRREAENSRNFDAVIEKHESMIVEWLNVVLYGIVSEI